METKIVRRRQRFELNWWARHNWPISTMRMYHLPSLVWNSKAIDLRRRNTIKISTVQMRRPSFWPDKSLARWGSIEKNDSNFIVLTLRNYFPDIRNFTRCNLRSWFSCKRWAWRVANFQCHKHSDIIDYKWSVWYWRSIVQCSTTRNSFQSRFVVVCLLLLSSQSCEISQMIRVQFVSSKAAIRVNWKFNNVLQAQPFSLGRSFIFAT